jgi:hypothetical protein
VSGVGEVLTQVSVLPVLLGGLLVAIRGQRLALVRVLGRTPVVACSALGGGGGLPRRVVVVGRVRAGADGELVAPVSGRPSVWWRVRVETNPGSESPGPHYTWQSGDRFTVADATGEVQVAARLIDRQLADRDIDAGVAAGLLDWETLPDGRQHKTLTMLRDVGLEVRTRRLDSYRIEEFSLAPGREITVLGRPRREGQVTVLARTVGVCGVSEQPVPALLDGARAAVKNIGRLPLVLLCVGLALLVAGSALRLLN